MITRPSRTTVFVGVATALSLLGDQAMYALLPLYFEELGLLPIQVGVLLSANRWIRLLTNHIAERFHDALPVHFMFALALLIGALLTFAYALVSSFMILLLARLAWGLCWSYIRHLAVMRVSGTTPPEQLGQMMGYYNGISRFGSVLGIVLGGFFFDLAGFTATLLIFGCASLPKREIPL